MELAFMWVLRVSEFNSVMMYCYPDFFLGLHAYLLCTVDARRTDLDGGRSSRCSESN